MSAPSFWGEVRFAAIAAVTGAIAHRFLRFMGSADIAWQAVAALLVLAYAAWLALRSPRPTGRVAILLGLLAMESVFLLFWPGDIAFLVAQAGFIWLSRSVLHHSGLLAIVADLGLNLLAVAAAAWALAESGSALLTFWTFFLAQAFFVRLPRSPSRPNEPATRADRFNDALREAEAALNRLAKSI